MDRPRSWWLRRAHRAGLIAAALLVLSAGCSKPTRLRLVDTEKRSFDATCEEGECTVQGSGSASPTATKPDGAEAGFVFHRASRYYSVCDVWKEGSDTPTINPIDCRLLQCGNDAECPAAKGLARGSCTNGLCIEPSGDLTAEDAGLLCLSGTGPPSGASKQIERFALGSNCGVPCQVPSVCRQP